MDENIPIFSGINITRGGINSLATCGQFLSLIEQYANQLNLSEHEVKILCQSKLSDKVFELFQTNFEKSWIELKQLMLEQFSVKLNIREKVEVRKKLMQKDTEPINDFYKRCVVAQYLVSDDIRDAAFEREVLLHFLIGLSPAIRDLVLATKCSSPEEYIREATHFQDTINNIDVKEEPAEEDIKIEADPSGFEDYDDYEDEQKPYIHNYDQDVNYVDDTLMQDESEISEKKWKCGCGLILASKQNLSRHRELCFSQKKCNYCDHISESKVLLKTHMKTEHTDILVKRGWRRCQICSEIFRSKQLKEEHEEKFHGHLKATCEICKEVCPSPKLLASHLAKKHCEVKKESDKESATKVMCLYCNNYTNSIGAVKYHILSIHFNQPNFKCNYCEKGFEGEITLENHVRTYHLMERSYQCDKCPKDFKTKTGLNHHILVNHTDNAELQCDQCDKTFKNRISLYGHLHSVHRAENTRIVCDDCGKSFKQKQTFKLHCLKEHSSIKELEKHKVYCQHPGCKYSALQKAQVDRHFDKVHLKMKDFPCTLCNKNFGCKIQLEEHVNGVHLNRKPHKCDLCEYSTAYKSKVRSHKKVAHGDQRYDCPHCNHSARYKGNLDKHINNVHKNLQCILDEKDII